MIRAAVTSNSYSTTMTSQWMNDYFRCGGFQPNGDKVLCLSVNIKAKVYEEYNTKRMGIFETLNRLLIF